MVLKWYFGDSIKNWQHMVIRGFFYHQLVFWNFVLPSADKNFPAPLFILNCLWQESLCLQLIEVYKLIVSDLTKAVDG
jgi:hypothetical protein